MACEATTATSTAVSPSGPPNAAHHGMGDIPTSLPWSSNAGSGFALSQASSADRIRTATSTSRVERIVEIRTHS